MRLNNTKHLVSLFLLLLPVTSSVSAQSVDDFDEISAQMDLEFNTQAQRIDDIYDAVDQAIDRAFKGLTKRIEVKWPDGALPDRHRWVTYNASMSSRAIADFDKGELVVETIIEPGADIQETLTELMEMSSSIATATPEQLDAQDVLREAVIKEVAEVTETSGEVIPSTESSIQTVLPIEIDTQLTDLNEQLATRMAEVEAEQQALATPEPETQTQQLSAITAVAGPVKSVGGGKKPGMVKQDTVAPAAGSEQAEPEQESVPEVQTASTNTKAAADTVEQAAPAAVMPVVDVIEENGQTRLQLRIAFVNDYQEKLFGQYFNEIKAYAKRYDVPVSVIMAIIETESSFNPRAVSPIPAFGLMQLVPKTAGLDAHLFVHGEKKIVSADYLFNEENNLKLGSAYFHLLTHRYLRKISDPTARFYCAVASYNTGVGNVAKTFTGKKSISAAVTAINQMAPGDVYDFLLTHLPAQETRNYLKKVVTRMEKYKQFDA